MQSYEQFKEELIKAMRQMVQSGSEITEIKYGNTTKTNNNNTETIFAVFNNGNVSPVIYVEELYSEFAEDYLTVNEIAERELHKIEEGHRLFSEFDVSNFKNNPELDNIYLQVINREMNTGIASTCAHIDIEDLMAVPRYRIHFNEDHSGSILINRDIQHEVFSMTDDELLSIAKKNTLSQEYEIKNIGSILLGFLNKPNSEQIFNDETPDIPNMYVITNKEQMHGASAILSLNTMSSLQKLFGESCFLIPSSVHELIALPESMVDDPKNLQDICISINKSCLNERDILGNNIYHYNGEKNKLEICNSIEQLAEIKSRDNTLTQDIHQNTGRRIAI